MTTPIRTVILYTIATLVVPAWAQVPKDKPTNVPVQGFVYEPQQLKPGEDTIAGLKYQRVSTSPSSTAA